MNKRTQKLILLLGVLHTPLLVQSMSHGQIIDIRDNQFHNAIKDAQTNGVSSSNLMNACSAIQTNGVSSFATYYPDFYTPFVKTFSATPENACAASGNAAQAALAQALPSRGGTMTVPSEQAALKAVQDYIRNGGSPLMFLSDIDTLIANLVSTGGAAAAAPVNADPNVITIAQNLNTFYMPTSLVNTDGTVNMANLVKCSNDFKTFLSSLPASIGTATNNFTTWTASITKGLLNPMPAPVTQSATSIGTDQNVVAIATAFNQTGVDATSSTVLDTFLSADGKTVTDMPALAAKIKQINDPMDSLTNPMSAFGVIDQEINIYQQSPNGTYNYNVLTSVSDWSSNIQGALKDLNAGYSLISTYTYGTSMIPNFTFDITSDHLADIIPKLVTAAKGDSGASGSSTASNLALTDPNLVLIGKALSGINGPVGNKDNYLITDGTALDPAQLSSMGTFATTLRSSLDQWLTGSDVLLSYTLQTFDKYTSGINNAVADETDIIEQLPDIWTQIGTTLNLPAGTTLTYDDTQSPSYNIYGSTDTDGNTIQNPNSLYSVMWNALGGTPGGSLAAGSSGPQLSPIDSVNALATMLADQIENHNNAVAFAYSRCGAMKAAFTDTPLASTKLKFNDGNSYIVTGAIGTATTRCVAEEVFNDVVTAHGNGVLTTLNNQALLLQKQAAALKSAGAKGFTATDGMEITSISYFNNTTITVGTSGAGTFNVTTSTYTI